MSNQSTERIHRLVNEAKHNSVTPDLLTETKAGIGRPRLHDRPLVSYLLEGEQPHFIFYSDSSTPNFHGPGSPESLERSRRYKTFHLVTDRSWTMVTGNRQGDQSFKLPLDDIEATNYGQTGRFPGTLARYSIALDTGDAFYDIPVSNDFEERDLQAITSFLYHNFDVERKGVSLDPDEAGYTIDGIDTYRPTRETISLLLDEIPDEAQTRANEVIEDESDPEKLVTRLNELIEDYEQENQSIDDIVAEAESAEELKERIESPADRIRRQAQERLDQARDSLRESEPEEVGEWAKGVGMTAAPLAAAAPWSTTPLLLSSIVLGSGLGVHSSSNSETVLDDIDPTELALHARAMSTKGQELDEINGEAVGALLGATKYLGQTLSSEEYASWFLEAEPEAILEGAEVGAKVAIGPDGDGHRRTGALTGSVYGLFAGYSGEETTELDEFRAILDDDVYKEYLEEVSRSGLELPD